MNVSVDKVAERVMAWCSRSIGRVRPTTGQVDDLLGEIRIRATNNQRVLVTTLTKRMAGLLITCRNDVGCATPPLEIHSIERIEIIQDLRLGEYDVLGCKPFT